MALFAFHSTLFYYFFFFEFTYRMLVIFGYEIVIGGAALMIYFSFMLLYKIYLYTRGWVYRTGKLVKTNLF